MELSNFEDDEGLEEPNDPIVDELLESDSVEVRAMRQLAVEDILAKIILSLYHLEELNHERVGARDILNILTVMVMDSAVGEVHGTAYTNVFDRISSLIDYYQNDSLTEE